MARYLSPEDTARAIVRLEQNCWLAAVAAELNVNKSCIFKLKRRWQQDILQRPIRVNVRKVAQQHEDNALVEFIHSNPFTTAIRTYEETNFRGSANSVTRKPLNKHRFSPFIYQKICMTSCSFGWPQRYITLHFIIMGVQLKNHSE